MLGADATIAQSFTIHFYVFATYQGLLGELWALVQVVCFLAQYANIRAIGHCIGIPYFQQNPRPSLPCIACHHNPFHLSTCRRFLLRKWGLLSGLIALSPTGRSPRSLQSFEFLITFVHEWQKQCLKTSIFLWKG